MSKKAIAARKKWLKQTSFILQNDIWT